MLFIGALLKLFQISIPNPVGLLAKGRVVGYWANLFKTMNCAVHPDLQVYSVQRPEPRNYLGVAPPAPQPRRIQVHDSTLWAILYDDSTAH